MFVFWTQIAITLIRNSSSFFTFSKIHKFRFIAFQFTQISKSNSTTTTHWHKQSRTEFASSHNRRTFPITLFHNSDALHCAFVIISVTVNSANWSVLFCTIARCHARSFALRDLLCAIQNTFIFKSVSS